MWHRYVPSHHQTHRLDAACVQRLRIRLRPPPVRRGEVGPRQEDLLGAFCGAAARYGEVSLVQQAALAVARRQHVLEVERVELAVGQRHRDQQAFVAGQVPVQRADGLLRGEAGAAQGGVVEVAREGGLVGGRDDGQVRGAVAAADGVVDGGPEGGVPGTVGKC